MNARITGIQQAPETKHMSILAQHIVQMSRDAHPTFVFIASWISEDNETMAETWIVLPEVNAAGRHLYQRNFNTPRVIPEQEFIQVARHAVELDLWRLIESGEHERRVAQLKFLDLTPERARVLRSLSAYPGLDTIVRASFCTDLIKVMQSFPKPYPRLYTELVEYPQ